MSNQPIWERPCSICGVRHPSRGCALADIETALASAKRSTNEESDMTDAQINRITILRGKPEDFRPAFDLPDGWVAGWASGVYYGISPEGSASS